MAQAKAASHSEASSSWVFFVPEEKPGDLTWAVPRRLSHNSSVRLVLPPASLWRSPLSLPLSRRSRPAYADGPDVTAYRPIHYPARPHWLGRLTLPLSRRHFKTELARFDSSGQPPVVAYREPLHARMLGAMNERKRVYTAVDDMTVDVSGRQIPGEVELEQWLLSEMDYVTCVTAELAERIESRLPSATATRVSVLPNGVDTTLFRRDAGLEEPPLLRKVPRPRVLVAGYLSNRLDWPGIEAALAAAPQWHWVFVGPSAVPQAHSAMARCLAHPRVRCFRPVSYPEVPAWMLHSDACAAPYGINAFSLASDPLRVLEYLACGRPTLTTRTPALEWLNEHVHWLEEGNGESYAFALERCIAESGDVGRSAARSAGVAGRDWTLLTEQFRKAVDE